LSIFHQEGKINVFLVIGHPNTSFFRGLFPIDGIKLEKSPDGLDILPTVVLNKAVNSGGRFSAGNMDNFSKVLTEDVGDIQKQEEKNNC